MKMDLDQAFAAHGQKAVALDVLRDVIVDGVFLKPLALNQQLRVKFVFQHDILLSLENGPAKRGAGRSLHFSQYR